MVEERPWIIQETVELITGERDRIFTKLDQIKTDFVESSKIALAKAMKGDLNINYDTCFAEWGERAVNSLVTAVH